MISRQHERRDRNQHEDEEDDTEHQRRTLVTVASCERADPEHDDAEEIAEIVPAATVGHRVDRDLVGEQ